jgi:aspartyl-tRNA(Asn)/glutamyl-tRNA(Gln) amidotransferase subunit B
VSAQSAAEALGYEAIIGLEVHAQLLTASKMFCSCSAHYSGAVPNSHVCPVDLGFPGSLPVVNERAVEQAIMVALALNCEITEMTRFDRKNYPYPDIPKGYQISQYDTPLGRNGFIAIETESGPKRVGIIRAHMEEDTGKTIHDTLDGREVSLVDYNRSGVPLLEIVSEADMRSADEARRYFMALRELLVFLGVNSGDMEQGALRADVNVSVRKRGDPFGVKVEIKNLNSFRSVARSLEFEIDRQITALERGEALTQETRGWDEGGQVTVAQRIKEFAEDYRYFPEPDLLPLVLDSARIESIRRELPESAKAMRERFVAELGLPRYAADVLTQEPALARLFDQTVRSAPSSDPKMIANWLTGELLRLLNETGIPIEQARVTPKGLAELTGLVANGTITTAIGKTVFEEMFRTGATPSSIVDRHNLRQVSDRGELEAVVRKVLKDNESLVDDYIGKDRKTEGPLVGKVMAATGGKANAALVKQLIADIVAEE